MAYNIIRPSDHKGWLDARTKGIGSSDVATLLGVNPYQTKLQLYNSKMGIAEPVEENEAMHMGHLLEPIVAQRFAEVTGDTIQEDTAGDWIAIDNEEPYLRCSPDRLFNKKESGDTCILECKTTAQKVDADNPPFYWFCQLQYQMGIMGIKEGALAWLVNGREFGYKRYYFDKVVFEMEKEAIREFIANHLDKQTPPQPETIDDVKVAYPKEFAGKTINAKELVCINENEPEELRKRISIAQALRECKAIGDHIKELTDRRNQIIECIQKVMEDAEAVIIDIDGTEKILATWKASKDSMKFNSKKFEKDNPEACQPYMELSKGTRRFLVK